MIIGWAIVNTKLRITTEHIQYDTVSYSCAAILDFRGIPNILTWKRTLQRTFMLCFGFKSFSSFKKEEFEFQIVNNFVEIFFIPIFSFIFNYNPLFYDKIYSIIIIYKNTSPFDKLSRRTLIKERKHNILIAFNTNVLPGMILARK
jgi:hypothetical protein